MHWHFHHMMLVVSSVAPLQPLSQDDQTNLWHDFFGYVMLMTSALHDTGARTGSSTDTKTHIIPQQFSQHDKCNGVTDGTISIKIKIT